MTDKLTDELDSMKIEMASSQKNSNSVMLLRNNRKALRACILYEFLKRKPILNSYKSFCKLIGGDVLEYRQFEFLYYKIGKEGAQLDSEIDWDQKLKSLGDIPINVVQEVVNKVTPIHRLVLRDVSQKLRDIIDDTEFPFDHVECTNDGYGVTIRCGKYDEYRRSCVMQKSYSFRDEEFTDEAEWKPFWMDLEGILRNLKLRLEMIEFKDLKFMDLLSNRAQIFLSTVYAKRVKLTSFDTNGAVSLLSLFKVENLEEIVMENPNEDWDIPTIIDLEQSRKAKSIRFHALLQLNNPLLFFNISAIHVANFQVRDAIAVRDVLMESANFESASFKMGMPRKQEILRVFNLNYNGGGLGSQSVRYKSTISEFDITIYESEIVFKKIN